MNYEFDGIMVSCPAGINEQEAAAYLKDQIKVSPQRTLISLELELEGDTVVIKPHYDNIVRLRRITGYLSTLPRFNDAKKQEATDRVAHL